MKCFKVCVGRQVEMLLSHEKNECKYQGLSPADTIYILFIIGQIILISFGKHHCHILLLLLVTLQYYIVTASNNISFILSSHLFHYHFQKRNKRIVITRMRLFYCCRIMDIENTDDNSHFVRHKMSFSLVGKKKSPSSVLTIVLSFIKLTVARSQKCITSWACDILVCDLDLE